MNEGGGRRKKEKKMREGRKVGTSFPMRNVHLETISYKGESKQQRTFSLMSLLK
jgi:hypothetical protein